MKKNILVVDDSALMRRVICDIINSDESFQATDTCKDGLEALETLRKKKYDGVLLDINMPRMDGLELLDKLQEEKIKATIIMVSTLTTKDAKVTILAMERGAIDFVTKPTNVIDAKGDEFKNRLLEVLNAVHATSMYSGPKGREALKAETKPVAKKVHTFSSPAKKTGKKLIALACSTGGPKSLQSVIPKLPKNLDAPMVLVQHMPKGFTKSLSDRLNELSAITVTEAQDGDILENGHVYIAPGGFHMEVKKTSGGGHQIALNSMPAIGGLRPCADVTYDSLRDSGFEEIVCVVLTGMGADGTKGILSLEKKKPIYVISQNAETCVVYGMPKAIYQSGVVDQVLPLDDVAAAITKYVGVK
ncbi:MAG: chemotaxis response regulator protein-glutamate methylesterase [Lachnospiraceae bacterium]|nr:chemotaxis response regulator protein-glutamate methylesterase [Lachnospiraceae bacterium]